MYSIIKRNEAIRLRKEGNSYADISSKISVSKSTLSYWLKGVPFVPNELTRERILRNSRLVSSISRVDKSNSLRKADDYAREHIKKLDRGEIFLFGLGIYLGEGSKTGGVTRVVNSDPRIIRSSMVWFKKCFGITDENFRVRLHIYPDNDENEAVRFWMKSLQLKREHFQPSYVDVRQNKKKSRMGVLPYGTAHLSVVSGGNKEFGVLLQRRIIASIDSALEKVCGVS